MKIQTPMRYTTATSRFSAGIASALMLFFCSADSSARGFETLAEKLAGSSTAPEAAAWSIEAEQAEVKAEVITSDPEVEFEYLWPSVAGEKNRWSAGISQELPNFFRMKAAGRLRDALASVGNLRREAALSDARYEAETRLLAIVAAHKEAELLKSVSESYDRLIEVYRKGWEKGEINILDLNKIKIEQARAKGAYESADGRLKALIAEAAAFSRGTVTETDLQQLDEYPARTLPSQDACMAMVESSPQARLLDASLSAAEQRIRLASTERVPGLTLGYSHAFEDGKHFNGLTAGLSLPLFSRKASKAAARAGMMATMADNVATLTSMKSALEADYNRAAALKRQIDRLGPVIDTTDNLRLLRLALDGGEILLLDYLQETNYFIEATEDYLSASYEYAVALASLYRYSAK